MSLAQLPFVPVDRVLSTRDAQIIDLRSPSEYAEDHMPGAQNVPLFDDVERSIVGTLYRQVSPQAAFERGREFVTAGIRDLVKAIVDLTGVVTAGTDPVAFVETLTADGIEAFRQQLEKVVTEEVDERPVFLHCWRGGMRSMSVVALLRAIGVENAYGIEGGYKRYRLSVMEQLKAWQAPPTFVVRGLTGVGKTLLLNEVERLRPGWTLDLEGCAGHRSSLLGKVGLRPVSQKCFESRIAARLRDGLIPELVVIEGESRKVGDAVVPPAIWAALLGGKNIVISADKAQRTKILREDYMRSERSRAELREQLPAVEQRMQGRVELLKMYDEGDIDGLIDVLLERYYDPLYRRSAKGRETHAAFDLVDVQATAEAVVDWIEGQVGVSA